MRDGAWCCGLLVIRKISVHNIQLRGLREETAQNREVVIFLSLGTRNFRMADISAASGKSESIATSGVSLTEAAAFRLRPSGTGLALRFGSAIENAITLDVLMILQGYGTSIFRSIVRCLIRADALAPTVSRQFQRSYVRKLRHHFPARCPARR